MKEPCLISTKKEPCPHLSSINPQHETQTNLIQSHIKNKYPKKYEK
jgi:hypothetical protein